MRGEDVPELWEKIEEHRAFLEQSGAARGAAPGEPRRARCSRSLRRARSRHLEQAVADDAELRRLLDGGAGTGARPADGGTGDPREGVPDPRWRRRPHPGFLRSRRARERLDGVARVTPVYRSETLSRLAGRQVRLKAENLQRTGSFKIRGAYNKLSTLEPSSARPASWRRAPATTARRSRGRRASSAHSRAIFMPQDAPMAKVDATRNYGAEVELVGAGVRGGARRPPLAYAERDRRDVHPSVRGRARDRRARGRSGSSSQSRCAERRDRR